MDKLKTDYSFVYLRKQQESYGEVEIFNRLALVGQETELAPNNRDTLDTLENLGWFY